MKCNKCDRDDPKCGFAFRNREKGKRHSICQDCQRQYKKKHYYANKEQYYRRNKEKRLKLSKIINLVKATGCIICQENEPACLDFHHMDPTQKDYSISQLSTFTSYLRIEREMSKCVILCSNCHRKFHAGVIQLRVSATGSQAVSKTA